MRPFCSHSAQSVTYFREAHLVVVLCVSTPRGTSVQILKAIDWKMGLHYNCALGMFTRRFAVMTHFSRT